MDNLEVTICRRPTARSSRNCEGVPLLQSSPQAWPAMSSSGLPAVYVDGVPAGSVRTASSLWTIHCSRSTLLVYRGGIISEEDKARALEESAFMGRRSSPAFPWLVLRRLQARQIIRTRMEKERGPTFAILNDETPISTERLIHEIGNLLYPPSGK